MRNLLSSKTVFRRPRFSTIFAAFLLLGAASTHSLAQQRVNLYDGPAPGSLGNHQDIDNPHLLVFLPPNATKAPAVIICPGGGYSHLSMIFEGTNVAKWWQSHGVAAMVLRYRLPGEDYHFPAPMDDGKRALRLVRSKAAEWHLDPNNIGIMGFSAGGHMASTLETHNDGGDPQAKDPVEQVSCHPNFAVLVYPVISLKKETGGDGFAIALFGSKPDPAMVESYSNETQVTPQTPPTLIVRAKDDKTITPPNGDLMLAALQKAGVPCAMQEYPTGGHGFGFAFDQPGGRAPIGWLDAAAKWLVDQKILPPLTSSVTTATPPPAPATP